MNVARSNVTRRFLKTLVDTRGKLLPQELLFLPTFFSPLEQRVLLQTSLQKLDSKESRQSRRRRSDFQKSRLPDISDSAPSDNLEQVFAPDAYYEFEEGHYDGVIHNFREMHLTSWPTEDVPELSPILNRLHSLLPTQNTQTHLLHLGSNGEILPHIDNLGASGSWILGVSLGATRILRMNGRDNDSFDVLLPSGSVYMQRDALRYEYTHAIPKKGCFQGQDIVGGQRLSIMIRDRISPGAPSRESGSHGKP